MFTGFQGKTELTDLLQGVNLKRKSRIGCHNVEDPAKVFLNSLQHVAHEFYDRRGISKALEEGFIIFDEEGKVQLLPVTSLPSDIIHQSIDNPLVRSSMDKYGIIGNSSESSPTYLASSSWHGETYCWENAENNVSDRIIFRLDSDVLLSMRSVYIDPESVNENVNSPHECIRELGKMFIVLGGIPKEAIKAVEYPWDDVGKRNPWGIQTRV